MGWLTLILVLISGTCIMYMVDRVEKLAFFKHNKPQQILLWLLTIVVFAYNYLLLNPLGFYPTLMGAVFMSLVFIVAYVDAITFAIYEPILMVFLGAKVVDLAINQAGFLANLAGAGVGFAFYLIIYWLAKAIYKEEVFGFGDVELLGLIGFYLGVHKVVAVGFIAFYMALVLFVLIKLFNRQMGLKSYMPFGPAISISAALVYYHFDALMLWYQSLLTFKLF